MGKGDPSTTYGQLIELSPFRYSGHNPSFLPHGGVTPLTSVELFLIYTSIQEETRALCLLINGFEVLKSSSPTTVYWTSHQCTLDPRAHVGGSGDVYKVARASVLNNTGTWFRVVYVQPPNLLPLLSNF